MTNVVEIPSGSIALCVGYAREFLGGELSLALDERSRSWAPYMTPHHVALVELRDVESVMVLNIHVRSMIAQFGQGSGLDADLLDGYGAGWRPASLGGLEADTFWPEDAFKLEL